MKRSLILGALGALLFINVNPADAKSYPKAGTLPVTEEFENWGWNWRDGSKYVGKVLLTKTDKGYILCGAGYATGGVDYNFNSQALASSYLTVNGKIVIENLRYFKNARSKKRMASTMANCRLTTIKGTLKNSDKVSFGSRANKFWD